MFHVAICDDEEVLCTQMEKYMDSYISKGVVKTEVFYSADGLYEALRTGIHFDLVFLDIEFHLTSGIEVGKKIRNELRDERIQIVYISAKQNYAMELFAIRPLNFLVKPIAEVQVMNCVEKAMDLTQLYDSYFEFKFGSENYRLPYGNIVYFESCNRKIYIHTKFGKKEMYGRLNAIEKETPPNFIRIHQSYLINRMYVTYWNSEEIVLGNDTRLPVSQKYRKVMCRALMLSERR